MLLKRQDFYQQSRCHCCYVYIFCNRSKYNWDLEQKMRRNYRNHRSLLQYKLAIMLTLCHTLRMGLQLKLLVIGVFLALALSTEAKNATVKVVGLIHCTGCSSNASSSGLDVFIICKAAKSETKTEANGAINREGKFSVTLSSMTEDPSSIDGCYAKLQGKSGAPCPIQRNQTASVKIVSNLPKRVMNRPTIIKFSPITCQSAIFWPFPNLTFFASPPPPPDYTPPPPPEDLDLPPLASPVQPPLLPPENSTPPLPSAPVPSYDPPAPEFGAPSPPPELSSGSPPTAPEFGAPSPQPELSSSSPPPAPPPTYQSLPNPTIQSPSPPPEAPPLPPQAPPVSDPIRTPTRPNPAKQTPPPTPALSVPPPQEKAIPPPPSRRKPGRIPRAPPIPRLPLTPGAPRKYFNAPKSKSKPPRFT